jgi:hypothetical protein
MGHMSVGWTAPDYTSRGAAVNAFFEHPLTQSFTADVQQSLATIYTQPSAP